MNLEELCKRDKSVLESLAKFYRDPNFNVIRCAFISHTSTDDDRPEIAYGVSKGTRGVFNLIETTVLTPPGVEKPKRSAQGEEGKPDPDLQDK